MGQLNKLFVMILLVLSLVSCSNNPGTEITKALVAFLDLLSTEQESKPLAQFSHKKRNDSDFLPDKSVKSERNPFGLVMAEVNSKQKEQALYSEADSMLGYSGSNMIKAANSFLGSLTPDQKSQAFAEFSHENRNDWAYLPDYFLPLSSPDKKRFGLAIKQMNSNQKKLVVNLLETALSAKGILTTENVRMLEKVIFSFNPKKPFYDPELYYVSIFGTPSKDKTWAWSFEGHHISINITLVNGHLLSVTPTFYGAVPTVLLKGEYKGFQVFKDSLMVLKDEENLAKEIAESLTDDQLKKAFIQEAPPKESFSKISDLTKVDTNILDPRKGLKYSEMNLTQQEKIKDLIKVYIEKFRPELIKNLDNSPLTEIETLVFVWVGSLEKGKPHYYRLCTTNHLIEYDNFVDTNIDAPHVHTVWREFDGDFGEDLLKKHYQTYHH